jgi:hypothetical protein
MTHTNSLKQYEVLSEDRRHAITIFVQAVLLSLAVVGFVSKHLYDATQLRDVLTTGIIGLLFLGFCHVATWKCRKYHVALIKILGESARNCDLQSPLSTVFIFDTAWAMCTLLSGGWLVLFFLKVFRLCAI